MHARCYNPKAINYAYYGGKNPPIDVSPEWHDFWRFVDDMYPSFKEGLTLERKDNALGYSKDNCIWATRAQQVVNRSMTLSLTFNGKAMNGTDWARSVGMHPDVFRVRIRQLGWSIERALTTPVGPNGKHATPATSRARS